MRLMWRKLGSLCAAFGWAVLLLIGGHAVVVAGGGLRSPVSAQVSGGCMVSGFVVTHTTWSPAGCDPYVVSGGNLVVPAGVTLTLLPGTTVKFDSQLALSVQGALVAQGTSTSPITFTSNLASPAVGDWGYLYFASTSLDATFDGLGNYTGGSILQYARIEYAGGTNITRNAAVRIDDSAPLIDANLIQDNEGYGIWTWNSARPLLTHNLIQRNGGGVMAGSGATVRYNQILSNTVNGDGGGLYISGSVTVSHNTIAGNTASSDGGGVYVRGSSAITQNIIVDNTAGSNGGGVYVRNGNKPPLNQNDIYGNTASDGDALYNDNTPSGPALNAEGNYWGTTDPAEIENAIYHFVDDAAVGLVDYDPFASEPITPPPAVATVWFPVFAFNSVNYFDGPWEIEDNDAYNQANGPLRSGVAYFGHPEDAKDYFSVYLPQPGQLVIDRTPTSGVGSGVQMLLFYETTSDLRAVAQTPPYHIDYTGPAGWYYIYLYTAADYNTTSVYTLTVTYP